MMLSMTVGGLFCALLIYLGYGLFQGSYEVSTILETARSPRLWKTIQKSCWIAFYTASCSVLSGVCLARMIQVSRYQQVLLAVVVFQLLVSPYVLTQGWIYWFGENGVLDLQLFSTGGLVFLLTLQNVPWVVVIGVLLIQPRHEGQGELATLLRWKWWERVRWLLLPRFRLGLALSFLWVFSQAFWAYDTASMLRQNMISLELMAAFGSFYDFDQALGVMLASGPILMLVAVLLGGTLRQCQQVNFRGLERAGEGGRGVFWFCLVLLLVLMALPIWGLMQQLPEWGRFVQTVVRYQDDFWNTLCYSVGSALVVLVGCFLLPRWRVFRMGVIVVLGVVFCVPSTIHGIVWTTTLNQMPLPVSGAVQVVLLLAFLLLPVGYALQWGLFETVHSSRRDFLKLSRWRTRLLLLKEVDRPKVGLLLLFLMLLASREVPALLLIYPAGGSSLALTIETMLHFDQAGLVSTLAVMQMGFTLLLFLSVRVFFGKL